MRRSRVAHDEDSHAWPIHPSPPCPSPAPPQRPSWPPGSRPGQAPPTVHPASQEGPDREGGGESPLDTARALARHSPALPWRGMVRRHSPAMPARGCLAQRASDCNPWVATSASHASESSEPSEPPRLEAAARSGPSRATCHASLDRATCHDCAIAQCTTQPAGRPNHQPTSWPGRPKQCKRSVPRGRRKPRSLEPPRAWRLARRVIEQGAGLAQQVGP
jgi:hypothetical protein